MPSIDAKVKKLEKEVTKLRNVVAKQTKTLTTLATFRTQATKWIELETDWTKQVTAMFHQVDWAAIVKDYPSAKRRGSGLTKQYARAHVTSKGRKRRGGTMMMMMSSGNPPQSGPDWPLPKTS